MYKTSKSYLILLKFITVSIYVLLVQSVCKLFAIHRLLLEVLSVCDIIFEICCVSWSPCSSCLVKLSFVLARGIMNGIDTETWNPETDVLLPSQCLYNAQTVQHGKAAAKAAFQERFDLVIDPNVPLFACIGRLADQKGIDVLLAAMPDILGEGAQLPLGYPGPGRELDTHFYCILLGAPLEYCVNGYTIYAGCAVSGIHHQNW
jgi:glycosyltransferase involved in cell wall biosynthesis